jgi:pSer/pThr/pTyr-binding forkhead associated (FHA) protein
MLICINCRAQQLDGTIFCNECGANLVPSGSRETTASFGGGPLIDELPTPPPMQPMPEVAPTPKSGPQLVLVIINNGRRMELDVTDDLLIGRKDEARGIYPDIDLGVDGGYDSGVSRRHAIVSAKEGTYRVEDLGSANGTFINGHKLHPQTPTPLNHGDELKCAMLLMRVEVH